MHIIFQFFKYQNVLDNSKLNKVDVSFIFVFKILIGLPFKGCPLLYKMRCSI